jgi:hypothetical protein
MEKKAVNVVKVVMEIKALNAIKVLDGEVQKL